MYGLVVMAILVAFSQETMASSNSDGTNGISGQDLPKMRTGFSLLQPNMVEQLKASYHQEVKSKISKSIGDYVSPELLLISGFTAGDQSNEEMAGCYIRLGSNLRSLEISPQPNSLSATAFLNSGILYALGAREAEDNDSRVDLSVSAAQSYYWAFCNEGESSRKESIKSVAMVYFKSALCIAESIAENEQRNRWVQKINSDEKKLK